MAFERVDKIHLDLGGLDFAPTRVEAASAYDEDLEKVGLDQVMEQLQPPPPPAFELEGEISSADALHLASTVEKIGEAIDARERGDIAFAEKVEAELEKHAFIGKALGKIRGFFAKPKPGIIERLRASQIASIQHAQVLEAEKVKLEALKALRAQARASGQAAAAPAADIAQAAAKVPGASANSLIQRHALPLGVAGGAGGALAVQRQSKGN